MTDYIKQLESKVKDCNNTNTIFDTRKYILLEDAKEVLNQALNIPVVVSSFLDNLKDSDSQALLEMRERNQEEFIKWCAKNPHAGVDDEWENEIMFMRDVAKHIEDLVV